jgi:hypothetical protein
MKYILNGTEDGEPTVNLVLRRSDDTNVDLIGRTDNQEKWLIAFLTSDGHFRPNKAGAKQCGLIHDDVYFQTLEGV